LRFDAPRCWDLPGRVRRRVDIHLDGILDIECRLGQLGPRSDAFERRRNAFVQLGVDSVWCRVVGSGGSPGRPRLECVGSAIRERHGVRALRARTTNARGEECIPPRILRWTLSRVGPARFLPTLDVFHTRSLCLMGATVPVVQR
jgi:hypothetical protein